MGARRSMRSGLELTPQKEVVMRAIMRPAKPLSCFLVVALLGAVIPYRPARAELVATESITAPHRAPESDRARVRALLDRHDVQAQLEQYGISAEEALARVETLTDQEIARVADRLDEVPAGGAGGDPVTAIAALLFGAVFLAVLVVAGIGWVIVWSVKKVANAAKHKSN